MMTAARFDSTTFAQVRPFRLCSAFALLAAASWTAAADDKGTDVTAEPEWTVLIVAANDPDDRLVPPPPPEGDAVVFPADAPSAEQLAVLQGDEADAGVLIRPAVRPLTVNDRTYEDIYRSIPYSYTEYLANPGYRHEATMEILFGQMRPTTIHKHYEPELIYNDLPAPYQPYRFSHPEIRQYRAPAFRLLNPGCCW